jgi:hypothetical protein
MLIQLSTVFGKSTYSLHLLHCVLHYLELHGENDAHYDVYRHGRTLNSRPCVLSSYTTISELQTLGSLHDRRFGKPDRRHSLPIRCATSSYMHSAYLRYAADFETTLPSHPIPRPTRVLPWDLSGCKGPFTPPILKQLARHLLSLPFRLRLVANPIFWTVAVTQPS